MNHLWRDGDISLHPVLLDHRVDLADDIHGVDELVPHHDVAHELAKMIKMDDLSKVR